MAIYGKYLSLPGGAVDWEKKLGWLETPEFKAAHEIAGFMPAVEWKGKAPSEEQAAVLRKKGVYLGWHAPNDISDRARDDTDGCLELVANAAKLGAGYIVVHGCGFGPIGEGVDMNDPIARYQSPVGAEEYLEGIGFQISLLRKMQEVMTQYGEGVICFENTSPTAFQDNDRGGLPTYCYPRVGNWLDLLGVAQGAGIQVLMDIGHMSYASNFLGQVEDHYDLPFDRFFPQSDAEHVLWERHGLGIRKGVIPTVRRDLGMLRLISELGYPAFYHIEGGRRDSTPLPVDGAIQCATHGPIEYDDERILQILSAIFENAPNCLLSLEVDGAKADGTGPLAWHGPTEEVQAESWSNLCRMCTDLHTDKHVPITA